jgi:hypothetical protein
MIEGKTIARFDDGIIFFTDGTAWTSHEYPEEWGWAEVQEYYHEQQGRRERERMYRLRDSLHPRDKQYLTRLERERIARAPDDIRAFDNILRQSFLHPLGDALAHPSRFDFITVGRRRKRKHRGTKLERMARAAAKGEQFVGNTIRVPIYRSR